MIFTREDVCVLPRKLKSSFFEGALEKICKLVGDQLTQSTLTVKFIILVGGFGQSPHLLKVLHDKFVQSGEVERVVQPGQGGLAVVSGGVLLGLDPSLIRTRKVKQTYGIEVEEVFDEERHEEARLVLRDNKFWCKGVFFPFVETGQEIDSDAVVERKFDITGGITRISIFTSPRKKIKYVDEKGVSKLGDFSITTPPPAPGAPSASTPFVIVRFQFGKIEFQVEAKDHLGTKCQTKFNFTSSF